MSQDNPFAGGLEGLMAQATQMQQQMQDAQQRAGQRSVVGEAAGGLVRVSANGRMEITRVEIDPKLLESDDLDMLQDLVLAATNQAIEKSRELVSEELGPLAGILNKSGLGGV